MKKHEAISYSFVSRPRSILVGCGDNSSSAKKSIPHFGGAEEVLQGVYDDQQNNVYIKPDSHILSWSNEENVMVVVDDIMTKKKAWERKFPAKKVVAMSIVPGGGGGYIDGLLIHYEY